MAPLNNNNFRRLPMKGRGPANRFPPRPVKPAAPPDEGPLELPPDDPVEEDLVPKPVVARPGHRGVLRHIPSPDPKTAPKRAQAATPAPSKDGTYLPAIDATQPSPAVVEIPDEPAVVESSAEESPAAIDDAGTVPEEGAPGTAETEAPAEAAAPAPETAAAPVPEDDPEAMFGLVRKLEGVLQQAKTAVRERDEARARAARLERELAAAGPGAESLKARIADLEKRLKAAESQVRRQDNALANAKEARDEAHYRLDAALAVLQGRDLPPKPEKAPPAPADETA